MSNYKNQIRIIGGSHKRRIVRFADVGNIDGFRPTPDRVRETLFNWLGQDLPGQRCLDAFSGSGGLAFEAASRGAAAVVALETSRRALDALTQNQKLLELTNLRFLGTDAFAYMAATPERFDVIFLDPPFAQDWWMRLAPLVARIAAPGARVYCEFARELQDKQLPGFTRTHHGRAGVVHYHLFAPKVESTDGRGQED